MEHYIAWLEDSLAMFWFGWINLGGLVKLESNCFLTVAHMHLVVLKLEKRYKFCIKSAFFEWAHHKYYNIKIYEPSQKLWWASLLGKYDLF